MLLICFLTCCISFHGSDFYLCLKYEIHKPEIKNHGELFFDCLIYGFPIFLQGIMKKYQEMKDYPSIFTGCEKSCESKAIRVIFSIFMIVHLQADKTRKINALSSIRCH